MSGRSACITHSWLPFTTGSVGMASEWRFGTSLVKVARDCLAWEHDQNKSYVSANCQMSSVEGFYWKNLLLVSVCKSNICTNLQGQVDSLLLICDAAR